MRYPEDWVVDALLSDGAAVCIRPIRPDDGAALSAFHDGLSEETVYRRFFSYKPHLTERDVERFTHVDYRDRMAFVAVLGDRLIGVARYDRMAGTDEAEVAFVIADAHQGRGLGTVTARVLARLRGGGGAGAGGDQLSEQEGKILDLVAEGLTNRPDRREGVPRREDGQELRLQHPDEAGTLAAGRGGRLHGEEALQGEGDLGVAQRAPGGSSRTPATRRRRPGQRRGRSALPGPSAPAATPSAPPSAGAPRRGARAGPPAGSGVAERQGRNGCPARARPRAGQGSPGW
jgi:hypothetical protein